MAASGFTPIALYNSATATNTPLAANLASGELAINTNDGKLFYKDSSGVVQTIASKSVQNGIFLGTGSITLPIGTTAQQPASPTAGMLRFNSTLAQFEGYNGTAWASVGGSALSNDTATATTLYPVFAAATTGTALNLYTSNAKYLYRPSTGELQAPEIVANNGIIVNSKTVTTSYTIPTGSNAIAVGPVSVASGVTVTIPTGSRWLIL